MKLEAFSPYLRSPKKISPHKSAHRSDSRFGIGPLQTKSPYCLKSRVLGKFVEALAHCVFDTVSAACARAMGYASFICLSLIVGRRDCFRIVDNPSGIRRRGMASASGTRPSRPLASSL
jgi:hypothetical protein